MTGRAYFDARGRPAGYHSIGRDVTERVRLESVLQQERQLLEERVKERTAALSVAKQAAEAALRTKTVFLANMGHELRTPMTLIMGMTELALKRAAVADVRPMLQRSADGHEKAHGAAQRSDRPGGAGGTPGPLPARAFVCARGGCQLGKADRPACGTKRLVAGTRARHRACLRSGIWVTQNASSKCC